MLYPGIVQANLARDLPKIMITGYRLIPSSLMLKKVQEVLSLQPRIHRWQSTVESSRLTEWPVCPYLNFDCRPMNASEEAHNLETSQEVWEKTLEMIGLSSDCLEKLVEGEHASAMPADYYEHPEHYVPVFHEKIAPYASVIG